ncbi:DUF4231 domain-containing protein [Salinibacterium soli]|uniref:DUF4231 domain-containing protein n=1 Tax=Antiquaquibacter soli TaxID=3064523 RepID=UPI0034E44903
MNGARIVVSEQATADVLKDCDAITSSIKKKADHYKRMSRIFTILIAGFTASIPVIVGLPIECDWITRTLPGVLAATAALAAVAVQFEKPQERWNLYRRYQRILEGERLLFTTRTGIYKSRSRDRRLARRLTELQLDLHDEWSGLVPRSADVASSASGLGGLRG